MSNPRWAVGKEWIIVHATAGLWDASGSRMMRG